MTMIDKFIESPNLPQNKVSLALIDARARGTIVTRLQELGISLIFADRCCDLYEAVAYHPDMFIHHIGSDCIVAAPNAPERTLRSLKNHGFQIIKGETLISGKYPDDTAYNVARIGDYAICNMKHTDKTLLNCLSDRGVKVIDIKQGYAKCSICIIDVQAIITSDNGIYEALKKYDFDILKVRPGGIGLKGLEYGFIGGASGLIDRDMLAFAGNTELRLDYKKILDFTSKYGKHVANLDSSALMDIGTLIPLKEYCIEEIC